MIYLDANIFIYPIVNPVGEERGRICGELLLKAASKRIDAFTSLLTWDEVVHSIKRYLGRDIAVVAGKKFIEFPNLTFLRVDEGIISEAQILISKYNLNPRDAIHASTAIRNGIKKIISDNPDFDKVKEIKRIRLEEFK